MSRFDRMFAAEAPKKGVKGKWISGDTFSFEATGADGLAVFSDRDILITVDLSFLTRPFKGEIEEGINVLIDKALSGEAPEPPPSAPQGVMMARQDAGIASARMQPLGPQLAVNLGILKKDPEPKKEISRRQKAAMVGGVMVGVTTIALVPGPLGRVISGGLSGYSAYTLICDLIGGC
jgi:hypothetical protein